MSEKYVPKKGDRVRVVLEGEVDAVSPWSFTVNQTGIYADEQHVVSVEKLPDPLPTTADSVIRAYGSTYVLRKGGWFNVTMWWAAEAVPSFDQYTIVFDAGKVES